jgi:hypothetical protein
VIIFDQIGTLLVKVDASGAVVDITATDDGTGQHLFKQARATLCAVVADTSGTPHLHVISDPNVKHSIMQTDQLNIFTNTWYYGSNFVYIDNPVDHNEIAKLILFDANVPGNDMATVIGSIMKRTGHVTLNIGFDSVGVPDKFVDPTNGQQYNSVANYHQRKAIADDMFNELKFSEFEWGGQTEGQMCYDYLRLKHNRDMVQLKSFLSPQLHDLIDTRAMKSQYQIQGNNNKDNGNDNKNKYTGFDENSQFLHILQTMETDWIAIDYWSELMPFEVSKHISNNQLTHGLYLLNRCPTPRPELLIYYADSLYTSHFIKF